MKQIFLFHILCALVALCFGLASCVPVTSNPINLATALAKPTEIILTVVATPTPEPTKAPEPSATPIPEYPVMSQEVKDKLSGMSWEAKQDAGTGTWYIVDKATGTNVLRFPQGTEKWQARHDVTMAGKNYEGWVVDEWENKDVVLEEKYNKLWIGSPESRQASLNHGIKLDILNVTITGIKIAGWKVVELSALNSSGLMETSRLAYIDAAYLNSMNQEVHSTLSTTEAALLFYGRGDLISYLKELEKSRSVVMSLGHKNPVGEMSTEKVFEAYYGWISPRGNVPYCINELDCRLVAGNFGEEKFTYDQIYTMLQQGADFSFDLLIDQFSSSE